MNTSGVSDGELRSVANIYNVLNLEDYFATNAHPLKSGQYGADMRFRRDIFEPYGFHTNFKNLTGKTFSKVQIANGKQFVSEVKTGNDTGTGIEVNPGSNWYERSMLWAMEQDITDGSNPMGDITREQLATMFWRNAGSPSATADLSQFSDNNTVSGYALGTVNWAVANGILSGSDGKLNMKGTATRAQVAGIVMRYGERVGA